MPDCNAPQRRPLPLTAVSDFQECGPVGMVANETILREGTIQTGIRHELA